MTRPAGVTASAVVCVLGSGVTLLLAAAMALSALVAPGQTQVPHLGMISAAMAVVFIGFAALGVASAVGLWRLRPWARTSVLVFAGFMTVMSALSGGTMAFIPLPGGAGGSGAGIVRTVLLVAYAVPFAVGVWWLVQFNAKGTKAAFAAGGPVGEPTRPLSISIIGWFSLVSGVFAIIPAVMRMPVFFGGMIFTGWGATMACAGFAAVLIYMGRGLLQLSERARLTGLVYYGVMIVQTLVVLLVPGMHARMIEYLQTLSPAMAAPSVDFGNLFFWRMQLVSVLLVLVPLWFLVRRKAAFQIGSNPVVSLSSGAA